MLKKCGKLEQYQRRDNLRSYRERDETEDSLENKVVELALNMGVDLQPGDISAVHRLGEPRDADRPLIIRSCRRKKRNEILR